LREKSSLAFLGLFRMMNHLDSPGLAAPAGVDLCLDHAVAAHHLGGALDLVGGQADPPAGDGDVVAAENLLGLVFVDVHWSLPPSDHLMGCHR